jgi:prolyl oligopeptidase
MHDSYLYLEKAHSAKSVKWAKKQTTSAVQHLSSTPSYTALYEEASAMFGDDDKTNFAVIRNDGFAYAFVTTKHNPLGTLCRMTARDYKNGNDNWDVLLDVDALAKTEGTNWSFAGSTLSPNKERLMISLSPDGGDAKVVREFDIKTKSFTNAGLDLELGKIRFTYVDDDTLYVASNCDGEVTKSSYAKNLRLVKRGINYQDSEIIYTIDDEDMLICAVRNRKNKHNFIYISKTFWESEMFYINKDETVTRLNLPKKLSLSDTSKHYIYLHLQEDWLVNGVTYPTGAIVSVNLKQLIKGKQNVKIVYQAPKGCVTDGFKLLNAKTAIISQMKDVCGELLILKYLAGVWHVDHKIALPENGSPIIGSYIKKQHILLVKYTSYTKPTTQYAYSLKNKSLKLIKSQKSFFDSSSMEVTQKFATSDDGTKIPYFMLHKKGLKLNGRNPTILYGYGGFSISLAPSYGATNGKLWVERGGVYVVACIRGGAEYGPEWHTSVLKQNRHKCYEDFESVASKLISSKVTSPKHLGIHGGSNGGLLVGACVTRRPELFGAVCCAVPLLDMLRLKYIGAGASWLDEYGDPDESPEMKEYLEGYSPYHNVKKGVEYPRIYFTASQADDRTHPCHARKMVALMQEKGHDVLYNETAEGGHTGGTDINSRAKQTALLYSYFHSELTD